jgi:hypothetical protein
VEPHCVASVHRIYLSVTCKHVHIHTHTEFYIEFSRSMVMRQTYVVLGGMDNTVI